MIKKVLAAMCLLIPVSADLYGSEVKINNELAALLEKHRVKVTFRTLECKKKGEVCHRKRDEDVTPNKIVTCITVGQTVEDAIDAFKSNGTGFHFVIGENGEVYWLVSLDSMTFAAGPKYNPSSIFIGLVNPGAWVEGRTYNGFWKSQSLEEVGGILYFLYPKEQIEVYDKVRQIVQGVCNIPDENVLLHNAVTPTFPYFNDMQMIVR